MNRSYLAVTLLFLGTWANSSAMAEDFSLGPSHQLNPASPLWVGGRSGGDHYQSGRPTIPIPKEPVQYCGSDKGEVTIQHKGRGIYSSRTYTLNLQFNPTEESFHLFYNSGIDKQLSFNATTGFVAQEYSHPNKTFYGFYAFGEQSWTNLITNKAETVLGTVRDRLRDLYSGAKLSEKSLDIQCALQVLDKMRKLSR